MVKDTKPSKLAISYLAANKLSAHPRNSRTHSPEQVDQIATSIGTFGFTNPILIDEQGVIIAGHGRLQAATLLGLQEVPCITLTGLSEAQRRAYMIADNKIALNAGWDTEMLAIELEELGELGIDTGDLGFTDEELKRLNEGIAMDDEGEGNDGVFAKEGKDTLEKASTMVVVGEYRVTLTRDQYKAWLEQIRQTAGFEDAQVKAEIMKRLGL